MRAVLATLALLAAGAAAAQSIAPGARVEPINVASAFAAPPETSFADRGEMVSMLLPGSQFVVRESVIVEAVGAQEEWIRIAPSSGGIHPCAQAPCWAFNRRLGEPGAFRRASR